MDEVDRLPYPSGFVLGLVSGGISRRLDWRGDGGMGYLFPGMRPLLLFWHASLSAAL